MRKTAIAVMLVVGSSAAARADEPKPEPWRFTSLTVSAGESAISGGITGTLRLEKGRTFLESTVQQKQGWLILGRKFHAGRVSGDIGGSVGHFDGAPWFGPYVTAQLPLGKAAGQAVGLNAMAWPGIFLWEPDGWRYDGKPPNPEALKTGNLGSIGLTVGPVGLEYALLDYLDEPLNKLPAVKYTQKFGTDFSVTGSVTRNSNTRKWMFYVGTTWAPSR